MKVLIAMLRFPLIYFPLVSIILSFSFFISKVAALEVDGLYQANVVVDSQDKEQREHAIEKALAAVFLKVGGKHSSLTHQVLQTAQKNASRYVSQYRYQRNDGQLSLIVMFNEDQVNELFKAADLALWGSLRPQVLLWLIDEQGTTRSIVSADADSIIPLNIHDFSVQRGLPITMPLMDLIDNEQVVLTDFWHYSHEHVQQASLRYLADMVVVMRVSDSSLVLDKHLSENLTTDITTGINTENLASQGSIPDSRTVSNNSSCDLLCQQQANMPKVLDWRVYMQGALYTQQYQGVDKMSLITQGLADITELIYQSYALSTAAENNFIIEVQNITSLKSDTAVANFLINLSAVKTVTLTRVQGDIRHFKLELIGSKASLIASLKLNNKLTQKIETPIDSQSTQHNYLDNMVINTEATGGFNNRSQAMKVIILGDDNTAAKNAAAPVANEIIDSTAQEQQSLTELDAGYDTYTDEEQEQEQEQEQAQEQVIPQTIIPNIPVFYWEQG